jgi:hypothetical protein
VTNRYLYPDIYINMIPYFLIDETNVISEAQLHDFSYKGIHNTRVGEETFWRTSIAHVCFVSCPDWLHSC